MSLLINGLDVWVQKFLLAQYGNDKSGLGKSSIKPVISDQEWMAFYQSFDDWFDFLKKALECVGSPLRDSIDLDINDQEALSVKDPSTPSSEM